MFAEIINVIVTSEGEAATDGEGDVVLNCTEVEVESLYIRFDADTEKYTLEKTGAPPFKIVNDWKAVIPVDTRLKLARESTSSEWVIIAEACDE